MSRSFRFLGVVVFVALGLTASALEFTAESTVTGRTEAASSTETANQAFIELSAGVLHESDGFRMVWNLGFTTENEYPAPFMGDFYGDFAVDILEAGMTYKKGYIGLSLGKLENRDVVDSPYSLFISGLNRKAMLGEISFEDEHFFFFDRWIGLNRNLDSGLYKSTDPDVYDDRGAVLKTYGLKFGRFRFGFQDAAVFTGDYFDVDFFANLAPGFFVQYVASAIGRPWTRSGNQNSLMGFFADYTGDDWTAYAQLLVDDINMNRFLKGDADYNPDKIALSFGGTWESPYGRLGAYAAGATRYTFESIGNEFYSYTYYPASAVISDGTTVGIPLDEEMLGYVHGENNLALMTTWARAFGPLGLGASLEFTLSGSKSPANPWHEGEDWGATRWLDDPVLEKKIVLGLSAAQRLGPIVLSAGGKIGWVQNRLELSTVTDDNSDGNSEPIWMPSSDSGLVGEFSITGRYTFQP